MKIIIASLALCFCASMSAQNVWEKPEIEQKKEVAKPQKEAVQAPLKDQKYLLGAVPEVDGKVTFTLEKDIPGKSAEDIYNQMLAFLQKFTSEENQLEGSAVSLVNKQEHIIVATVKEWLVFKNQALSLDRTKFFYALIAECKDGHLKLTMNRINYLYDESIKGGTRYKAEEWISDREAVNKKGTRLLPLSGKFRRKTIDRKDNIFQQVDRLF